jgi:hypothetical protein
VDPGNPDPEHCYRVLYFGMFSRDVDDKIIYALNLSTPTASIQARGANSTGMQKKFVGIIFHTFSCWFLALRSRI